MSKSLTETAKAILQGQKVIKESNDATPDRDAKKMTPNASTLRPGSKNPESRFSNPGAMSPSAPDNEVEDLGPALVKQGDVPPSAKAAGKTAKDTSKSSQSGRPSGEQFGVDSEKKQDRKNKEVMEEDVEISEELETFVKEMLEQGLSEEEIANAIEENFELVEAKHEKEEDKEEEEKDEEEEDEEDKKEMKENYQIDMSEHVDALLAGENLSEEFKSKATTIFEAAVASKLEEEVVRIQEAYAETLEEQVETIKEELSSNVDDYLNYVVENWVKENEVAIESGLRTELTEDFISGLKQLFSENYIDVPEEKISVVDEMSTKVQELEARLNEELENNIKLKKTLSESKKFEILVDACNNLTDTQAEKLKGLAENIDFTTTDEYARKINTLKENYFPSNVNSDNALDNREVESDSKAKVLSENTDNRMNSYVRTLGKKLPN